MPFTNAGFGMTPDPETQADVRRRAEEIRRVVEAEQQRRFDTTMDRRRGFENARADEPLRAGEPVIMRGRGTFTETGMQAASLSEPNPVHEVETADQSQPTYISYFEHINPKDVYNSKPVEPTRSISEKEYKRLEDAGFLLECLKACGVDNWDGYSDAMEMYEMGEEK